MGNINSIKKINFEDIQYAIQNNICIISTLPSSNQKCLIKNTISCENEETVMNNYLSQHNKKQKIIIYGKNNNDVTIFKKYQQTFKNKLKQCTIATSCRNFSKITDYQYHLYHNAVIIQQMIKNKNKIGN